MAGGVLRAIDSCRSRTVWSLAGTGLSQAVESCMRLILACSLWSLAGRGALQVVESHGLWSLVV